MKYTIALILFVAVAAGQDVRPFPKISYEEAEKILLGQDYRILRQYFADLKKAALMRIGRSPMSESTKERCIAGTERYIGEGNEKATAFKSTVEKILHTQPFNAEQVFWRVQVELLKIIANTRDEIQWVLQRQGC